MKEILKRNLNKTYLILSSENGEYQEGYELEMLSKNVPGTLLNLCVMRMDDAVEISYDITSKQTLREFMLHGKIPGEMIFQLFRQIVCMEREMRNYLLDMQNVIMDPEHIYRAEDQFYFCYCPWQKNDILTALRDLLEQLLGTLDDSDTKGIALSYRLYQKSCGGDFDIEKILSEYEEEHRESTVQTEEELLKDLWEEASEAPFSEKQREEEPKERKPGFFGRIVKFFLKKEEQETEAAAEYPDAWEEVSKLRIPGEEEEYFGFVEDSGAYETMEQVEKHGELSKEDCATVLLDRLPAGGWKLLPLLPGYEEFAVSGESFLVGKNKGIVDGYIGRETISRIHSRLYVKEGKLYIADANSTNGTFVNGKALEPGIDAEIFSGDRVLFADVGYECYNSL